MCCGSWGREESDTTERLNCTELVIGRSLQQLWSLGSVIATQRLESAGSGVCGTWSWLLRSMWDVPGPGLEPMSPALADELLTTRPPGKPQKYYFKATSIYLILTIGADCEFTEAISGSIPPPLLTLS